MVKNFNSGRLLVLLFVSTLYMIHFIYALKTFFQYLDVHGNRDVFYNNFKLFIPEWVEIFVDSFALVDNLAVDQELDVRIRGATGVPSCEIMTSLEMNTEGVIGVLLQIFCTVETVRTVCMLRWFLHSSVLPRLLYRLSPAPGQDGHEAGPGVLPDL